MEVNGQYGKSHKLQKRAHVSQNIISVARIFTGGPFRSHSPEITVA